MSKITCPRCGGTGTLQHSMLAKRRKELGISQADVAVHLGIQRSTYSMVESGNSNLTADKILPLAELLRWNAGHLLEVMYVGDEL